MQGVKYSKLAQAPPATGTATATSPRFRNRTLLLLLVSLGLVLFGFSSYGSAQLLFPINIQYPFQSGNHPSLYENLTLSADARGPLWSQERPPRIAIIGGGAGGSSAAYFLAHFASLDSNSLATDVTLFEKEDHIGGRSTIAYPWNEDVTQPSRREDGEPGYEELPVEVGASIFVEANKNLVKAVRVFNLTLAPERQDKMAIYDGVSFVYQSSSWGYWSDVAKLWWRYGSSLFHVRDLVKQTVDSFLSVYTPSFVSSGPFTCLASFAESTNLTNVSSLTALSYFDAEGVSHLFTEEIAASATRVNYGSSIQSIHALGALVSLATDSAHAVEGGNRKIFEEFAKRSGAKLVAVIFAGPIHQSGIQVINSPALLIVPKQPYVHLHVTFIVTTSSTPLPAYFGLPPRSSVPTTIYSTTDANSSTPEQKPQFNSLNYLKTLDPVLSSKLFGHKIAPEEKVHVVKMFSAEKLSQGLIGELFGEETVLKVFRKEWDAYPRLTPIEQHNEGDDQGEDYEEMTRKKALAPVRIDQGSYYVNGFERLISTMETETVSSFNVVSLLLQDFFNYTAPQSWAEWQDDKAEPQFHQ